MVEVLLTFGADPDLQNVMGEERPRDGPLGPDFRVLFLSNMSYYLLKNHHLILKTPNCFKVNIGHSYFERLRRNAMVWGLNQKPAKNSMGICANV